MRSPKVLRRLVLESLLGGGKVYVSRGDAAAHLEEEGITGQYSNVGFMNPQALPIVSIPWEIHEEAKLLGMDAEELWRQRQELAEWVEDDERKTPAFCACMDPFYGPGDARCGLCGGLLGRSEAERASELMTAFGLWS